MNIVDQIDKEIDSIEKKGISINNIDILYKLSVARSNCIKLHLEEKYKNIVSEVTEYKNNAYDKDINMLYAEYVASRKAYCKERSDTSRVEMLKRLNMLFGEIEDLINDIWKSAMCDNEREEIEEMILKISRH